MPDSMIPPEEQRLLDALRLDREDVYRAWRHGRLYGRLEAWKAIRDLPSVFGAPDPVPASLRQQEGDAA